MWERDGERLAEFRVGAPDSGVITAENIAWSPDGLWIAAAGRDKLARLFNPDGTPGLVIEHASTTPQNVAWSPDSKTLASSGDDNTVRLWKVDGAAGSELKHEGYVSDVAWSHDGKQIATATGAGRVWLWNADGSRDRVIELGAIGAASGNCWSVDWSPDDDRLVGSGEGCTLFVVSRDGSPEQILKGHPDQAHLPDSVAFSPNSDSLATTGFDHPVWLWIADGSSGAPMLQTPYQSGRTKRGVIAWSPDGKRLAASGLNRDVQIFQTSDSTRLLVEVESSDVNAMQWSPNGKWLAIGEVRSRHKLRVIQNDGTLAFEWQPAGPVRSVHWGPDSQSIVTCDESGTVRLWQCDGTPGSQLDVENEPAETAAFSPDGKLIAVVYGMTIRLWRPDGTQASLLTADLPNPGRASGLAWSRDNKRLMSGHADGTLRLWDVERGQLKTLSGHDEQVISVDWSHDGRRIVSYSSDSTVIVRNAETGEPEWTAVLLKDGQAASFTAAGQPLVGDSDLMEKEFVYVVEAEDGRLEVLRHSEFQRRITATK